MLAEARPDTFRLVVAPQGKDDVAPKLRQGVKPGSSLELVARGETNLRPFGRLEVVDTRPIGACDPPPRGQMRP